MTNKTVNSRIAVSSKEFNQKKGYNDFTIEAVQYLKSKDQSFYRINKDYISNITEQSSFNDAKVQGYYGLSSYSSFNQLNYIRFLRTIGEISPNNEVETRWVPGLINRPLLNSFAGVKYSLSKRKEPLALITGDAIIGSIGNVKLLENKHYLPLGFVYNKYVTLNDFKCLSKIQKDILLYQAAVVESPSEQITKTLTPFDLTNILTFPTGSFLQLDLAISQSAKKIGEISRSISENNSPPDELLKKSEQNERLKTEFKRLLDTRKQILAKRNEAIGERQKTIFKINSFSENNIMGTVNITTPGILFFSIPFDKGWHIFINGKEAHLERVNAGFSGIFLDKGEYDIELKFEVPYLCIGLIVSSIALMIYVGLSCYYFIKRREQVHLNNSK
jgi:uncharacterized membrane protein YfhO